MTTKSFLAVRKQLLNEKALLGRGSPPEGDGPDKDRAVSEGLGDVIACLLGSRCPSLDTV